MASLCRRLLVKAPSFCRVLNRTTTTVSSNLCRNVKRNHLDNLQRRFSSAKPLTQKETVTIHFLARDGERMTVKAKVGDNLLDTIVDEDVDLDGFGACEGTLACSTCHLIFKTEDYDKIGETPTDEELDMLDLAFGLEDTSRLGCQVIVTKEMDGWEIRVPEGVADAREP